MLTALDVDGDGSAEIIIPNYTRKELIILGQTSSPSDWKMYWQKLRWKLYNKKIYLPDKQEMFVFFRRFARIRSLTGALKNLCC